MGSLRIALQDWQAGFEKVELDKLLASEAGLGIARAKWLVDSLLDGEEISIGPFPPEDAADLAQRIQQLGAQCVVEDES